MIQKLIFLCGALASIAAAQVRYSATSGDVALVAAGTTLTIQQPATGAKQVALESVLVYCSVACNVTQSQNGTAATATAGTANLLLPNVPGPPASATVWTASNVGGGTAAGGIVHVAAAATVLIDLSKITMGATGTGTNYSIVISSISGTANITLIWREL